MKDTGIVRKVDELGRIVIPIEIRRTLFMPEGTPLEVGVDGNTICLRKYNPIPSLETAYEIIKGVASEYPPNSTKLKKLSSIMTNLKAAIDEGE